MLDHLADYARANGLAASPGTASRKISWAVDLTGQGDFASLTDLRQGGRPQVFHGCPDLTPSELAKAPHNKPPCRFLVETAGLLLGHPEEPEIGLQASKRAFAVELYRRASRELAGSAWLDQAASFLEKAPQRARAWQ